jgi:hypothetical protein
MSSKPAYMFNNRIRASALALAAAAQWFGQLRRLRVLPEVGAIGLGLTYAMRRSPCCHWTSC